MVNQVPRCSVTPLASKHLHLFQISVGDVFHKLRWCSVVRHGTNKGRSCILSWPAVAIRLGIDRYQRDQLVKPSISDDHVVIERTRYSPRAN